MKNLNRINRIQNLKDLLQYSTNRKSPMLINLNAREGYNNFLLDRMVDKLIKREGYQLEYVQMEFQISKFIAEELKIQYNPILLLIIDGNIEAIFSGLIAQDQLETVLQNHNIPAEHKEAS